jgi:hypothetical protein
MYARYSQQNEDVSHFYGKRSRKTRTNTDEYGYNSTDPSHFMVDGDEETKANHTHSSEHHMEVDTDMDRMTTFREGPPVGVPECDLAAVFGHPRDSLITFAPEKHQYMYRGKHVFSKSVSGIYSKYFSPFVPRKAALSMLKGREFPFKPKHLVFRSMPIWSVRGKQVSEWQEGAKIHDQEAAIERVIKHWEDGRDWGTAMHAQCERMMHGLAPLEYSKEVIHARDVIENLAKDGWLPFGSERQVYSLEHDLAGTIDALFYKVDAETGGPMKHPLTGDTIVRIVDWKRCEEFTETGYDGQCGYGPMKAYPDCKLSKYTLQIGLYQRLLDGYGVEVVQRQLVVLHPTRSAAYIKDIPDMHKEVDKVMDERMAYVQQVARLRQACLMDDFHNYENS